MARPLEHPTEAMTLRLTGGQTAQLAELARARGLKSAHAAALFALDVGLTLQELARMSLGAHALVPVPHGALLAFALNPGDAARAEKLINLWGEKEE
jgi:hypothetical protein